MLFLLQRYPDASESYNSMMMMMMEEEEEEPFFIFALLHTVGSVTTGNGMFPGG